MNERVKKITNIAISIANLLERNIGRIDIQSVNRNAGWHYIGYVWLVKDGEAPREFAIYEDGLIVEGGEDNG